METNDTALTDREIEEQKNISAFKEEAYERLSELETALLELEESPQNQELIDSAFRAMHTIKGSGGMFGFDQIVEFTHNIETVFDKVRDGEIKISNELIALTLSAHDQIQMMLEDTDIDHEDKVLKRNEITSKFLEYLPKINPKKDEIIQNSFVETTDLDREIITYRIRFHPQPDFFKTGSKPGLLLNELSEMGQCKIIAQTDAIPSLQEIDPELCYTWWDIILGTDKGKNEIEDVFIFVDDSCEVSIEVIDTDIGMKNGGSYKRLGEILVDRGDINKNELQEVLDGQKAIGEKLTKAGLIDISQVESALAEQQIVKNIQEKRTKVDAVSSIRVASHKLDKLIDLVGELVTAQARLSQIANTKDDSSVLSISEEIERLTAELRDNTMSVRMLTFGTTFSKFKRLIRDLASELDEDIVFITEGADTELDKNVIEQLNDPLIHILRNAADHGIESSKVRISSGKPPQGTIRLTAEYSGAHVLIKISDDGAGLDTEIIRKKAISKGFISKDTKLSDKDTYFLIFEPGFSTASKITTVSGRGVGMDVVKKSIEGLRGSIDIDSVKGQGSTITLKLPLTLAIIDGLLVSIGTDFFVIPLSSVKECIELTKENVDNSHGRHITNVRGQIIPYIKLRDQFNINGQSPEIEQIVITEIESHRIGFVVDSVIGQHQTVIKNLSRVYKDIETISGATIMADGTVALILDINKHLQFVEKEYLEQYS